MKALAIRSSALILGLALLAGGAVRAADDDDVPSFKKRGDNEKAFVEKVGTAIVKAARTASKIEMDAEKKYEFVDPKKDRKDLKIFMTYVGAVTKKKYNAQIVVKIDASDKEKWEVLNIEYKDDSISLTKPNTTRIQELVKKFNR
jgi:hypothetical protein